MIKDTELDFLVSILKKHRINSEITELKYLKERIHDHAAKPITGEDYENSQIKFLILPDVLTRTLYKFTDQFGFSYIYFSLTNTPESKLLLIGPYMYERPSSNMILEYSEKNSLSAKERRYLLDYYSSIQTVNTDGLFSTLLNSFCERLWESADFATVDVNNENNAPVSPIGHSPKEEDLDEILTDMKTMEKRYEHENELIDAVSRGQAHRASIFTSAFNDSLFEKRLPNLLRNAQNYCIIMNTLLRKAVESGGVHPVYIDRVSSDFALKIEKLSHTSETPPLMREMFTTYSNLVRNHTMSGYSELVKNTVLLIDSDISAPITPSIISKTLGVSLGYLSSLFKKETSKTLTEYITDKRIAHAKHLLVTTPLQIQTVAQRCGIVDLQYFSKLFKREVGQTPKAYREAKSKLIN